MGPKIQPSKNQNLMCIVYHDVKLPAHHKRQLKLYLQEKFYYIRIFTDLGSWAEYLDHTFIVNKLVMIVSGNHAEFLCEVISHGKESLQDPFVYELQFDQKPFKSELSGDRRFKDVDRLIEKIDDDINECMTPESSRENTTAENNDLDVQDETFPFGIHEYIGKQQSFCCLSREELKFVLFQSFIEVLLRIKIDEEEAIRRMWISCREDLAHEHDCSYLRKVNEYEDTYRSTHPIQFYTKSSFLFRTVNKAFRCEDIEKIFDFQPFIAHMHQQLGNLRQEQRSMIHGPENVLRRGKKLSKSVLQQLEDNKNKFISMNGFLSTTKSTDVADMFAGTGTNREGCQSVLFEMDIDGTIDTERPYADISKINPEEQEVLFFMGFVWRITAVDEQPDHSWIVRLQLSTDMDPTLTESFNELKNKCTFFTLGKILHELGEYNNAVSFYDRMLESTSELPEKTLADIHFHIAMSEFQNGSSVNALHHLEKSENLIKESIQTRGDEPVELRPILAEDASLSLTYILINKGLVYKKKKNYKRAKASFNEALGTDGTKNEKARTHYYLGMLCFCEKNYNETRKNYNEALNLTEDEVLKNDINQRLRTLDNILPIPQGSCTEKLLSNS